MANEEVQAEATFFNVKNTSLRLVHLGSEMIPPGAVRAILDDAAGINRIDVEDSDYLEETDDEATAVGEVAAPKKEEKTKKGAKAAKTATGAGWVAQK